MYTYTVITLKPKKMLILYKIILHLILNVVVLNCIYMEEKTIIKS